MCQSYVSNFNSPGDLKSPIYIFGMFKCSFIKNLAITILKLKVQSKNKYIYIYIYRERERERERDMCGHILLKIT